MSLSCRGRMWPALEWIACASSCGPVLHSHRSRGTMVLSLKHLKKQAAQRGCHLHLQVTNMRERGMIKPQAWSLLLQPSVTPSD